MPFKLQQIPPASKWCQHLRVPLLEMWYPGELVSELLSTCHAWEQRARKLSQRLIVSDVMAWSWFRQGNGTEVFAHLRRGLRWLWPDPGIALPTGGALTARRERLGIVLRRLLWRQWCRPRARDQTKGAFAFGWRLMAVESTLDEVPATPAHALHVGRISLGQSQSPFPQLRCLSLAEVGTHAIVDAVLARGIASEHALAPVILPSIRSAMRVMTERTCIAVHCLVGVQPRGAQVLWRLAAGGFTQRSRTLCDGS